MKLISTLVLGAFIFGCVSVPIGRRVSADPRTALKVGHDRQSDVLSKLGPPYRKFVDSRGHEVFAYLWADGEGAAEKCLVAFNEVGAVYLVEVY
ncbi:MAG: hypothetical protein HYV07_27800 [Deltaproteobacteria bacterium]|nr:hypothetical protein [Deltaproteobacteria bacterium]